MTWQGYQQSKREIQTAEARKYLEQRDIEERSRRMNNIEANKPMPSCGLTSWEWLDRYMAKRNALRNPPRPTTENGHDDENGRSVAGPEAAEGRSEEGVGDPPQEQGGGEAGGGGEVAHAGSANGAEPDPIERLIGPGGAGGDGIAGGASWLEDAYPESQEGSPAWTREADTPF